MLITGWRRSWRLWSVRVSAIGLLTTVLQLVSPEVLLTIWNLMPDEIRTLVPTHLALLVAGVLFAATILARLLVQEKA